LVFIERVGKSGLKVLVELFQKLAELEAEPRENGIFFCLAFLCASFRKEKRQTI